MTPYPSKEQLNASTEEYALGPVFVSHPDEPDTGFNPTSAEVRFLTIKGARKLDSEGRPPPSYLDVIDFGAVGGTVRNIKNTTDIESYLKIIQKNIEDLKGSDMSEDTIQAALETEVSGKRFGYENSPFDIHIEEQCYVVLILDHDLNWQFTPNSRGVTTKRFYGSDNFGLTFVIPNGPNSVKFSDPKKVRSVPISECRQLYFSAARRRPDCVPEIPGYNSKQGFNFHIEFFVEELDRRLPTIFDPTVPNSGGASFP